MALRKRWIIAPDPGQVRHDLAQRFHVSEHTARLLAQRAGSADPAAIEAFLRPSLINLHSPWLLPSMERAADRVVAAINNKESIVVYGDYDSDGVTAAALLVRIFRCIGHPVAAYLPDRIDEGYGLSTAFVRSALSGGVKLVITVDCGVSDFTEVAALQAGGVDVIVTDHHEPGVELPAAHAVINPKIQDCKYPFRELTGVGVAFKLAWAVCERLCGAKKLDPHLRQGLLEVLPYVAIGTITDVAPLLDENRVYVYYGLRTLTSSPQPGLASLIEAANLGGKPITPRDVSFRLGPRLNAAGRMQKAELALQVLVEDDREAARRTARKLDEENTNRQKLCQDIYAQARARVAEQVDLERDSAVVVVGEGWHEGVIGIVASRLVEEFQRPAVVIAIAADGLRGKGSARSVQGMHIYKAMDRSRQRFESFGGHEMAAGFSLMRDQIEPFRSELNAECRRQAESGNVEPSLDIDLELHLHQVTEALARELEMIAPFGQGNPAPLILTRHAKVAGRPQMMGNSGQHFSFFASQNQVAFRAVVFNHPEWLGEIDKGTGYWDLVYHVELNDFYSPPRLEIKVVDMRPS